MQQQCKGQQFTSLSANVPNRAQHSVSGKVRHPVLLAASIAPRQLSPARKATMASKVASASFRLAIRSRARISARNSSRERSELPIETFLLANALDTAFQALRLQPNRA